MGLGALDIGKALDAVGKVVGDVVTSTEERGKVLASLTSAKAQAVGTVLDFEGRMVEAQAKIIEAEAKSDSGLTRIWRPVLMLGFGYIVFHNLVIGPLFGLPAISDEAANLTPELWALLKLGIGGYVIGRSGEKIAKSVAPALSGSPEDLMKPKQLVKLRRKLAELEAAG